MGLTPEGNGANGQGRTGVIGHKVWAALLDSVGRQRTWDIAGVHGVLLRWWEEKKPKKMANEKTHQPHESTVPLRWIRFLAGGTGPALEEHRTSTYGADAQKKKKQKKKKKKAKNKKTKKTTKRCCNH